MSEISRNGDCVTVMVADNMVDPHINPLKEELRKVYEEGAKRIIIDMSGVEAIDSIGLRLLVATHNSLQKHSAKLELINPAAEIHNMLHTMRLDQEFTMRGPDEKP